MAQMHDVESSMFSQAGYDENFKVLSVRFKETQKAYDYSGVPPQIAQQFMQAESMGRFFNQSIRGRFSYTEVL